MLRVWGSEFRVGEFKIWGLDAHVFRGLGLRDSCFRRVPGYGIVASLAVMRALNLNPYVDMQVISNIVRLSHQATLRAGSTLCATWKFVGHRKLGTST